MARNSIACDQAIFTSIRTPMGEGYRIIAASRGLRPEEKQAITRLSPSHEGLCAPAADEGEVPGDPLAAAFYALPTGRLCIALSCFAGNEHTGRGGHRIYTHNVIVAPETLEQCGFNPLNIWRAMIDAGLTEPQLKPPAVLDELNLEVTADPDSAGGGMLHESIAEPLRRHVLSQLLVDVPLIVNLDNHWIDTAEAFLLAVPAPLRTKLSLAAGLKFSVSRCHRLNVLHDDDGKARVRTSGQKIEFLDPVVTPPPASTQHAWVTLVERHWQRGDFVGLARRTSRPFRDCSPGGRECVARLFMQIDDLPRLEGDALLSAIVQHAPHRGITAEGSIARELVDGAVRTITGRIRTASWEANASLWPSAFDAWMKCSDHRDLTSPILLDLLRGAVRGDGLFALEHALELSRTGDASFANGHANRVALDDVVRQAVDQLLINAQFDVARAQAWCDQWLRLRSNCPHADRLRTRCANLAAAAAR
ncbi:MAG: hypothetical protein J5J06_14750 [Phycisphaerae bacterium]|nr:hypothetical protein [Phycisphaerae bacterium]